MIDVVQDIAFDRGMIGDFFAQMRPQPRIKVSGWSDGYRFLPPESCAMPGKWRTSQLPFLREVMDAINDPAVHTVVVMFCSQSGKSEALLNILFYFMHQYPCPILVIQPTVKPDAQDFSKSRITPSLRDSPVLRDLFGGDLFKSRKSDNSILEKYFPGGRLILVGSNSVSGLSSRPIMIILGDEIDRYEVTKEGTAIGLATARQTTFDDKKLILTSTPSIKDLSEIEKWYNRSDKRNYYIPCEWCGEFITLKWENVQWDRDENENHLCETAMYFCQECGEALNDVQLERMVAKGDWEATAPFNGIAGFGDFPAMYLPWENTSMPKLAREWVDAQKDVDDLMVFVNTRLGQCFEDRHEKIDAEKLYERREPYGFIIPKEFAAITCQVDVQKDRLEVLTQAWGQGERCRNLEHVVIWGNPAIPINDNPDQAELFDGEVAHGVWNELDVFLMDKKYEHESGVTLPIHSTFIDSGFLPDVVYSYVKPREKKNIFAVKGSSTRGAPLISPPSKRNKGKVKLYIIGVHTGKNAVSARLRNTDPKIPGYMEFPESFSYEFFEQATNEIKKLETGRDGQKYYTWILPPHKKNEAFDLLVMGYANFKKVCPTREHLNRRINYLLGKEREIKENIPMPKPAKRRRVRNKGVRV